MKNESSGKLTKIKKKYRWTLEETMVMVPKQWISRIMVIIENRSIDLPRQWLKTLSNGIFLCNWIMIR